MVASSRNSVWRASVSPARHAARLISARRAPSPAAFGASDHAPFAELGIPYIYFEATNWWAKGSDPWSAYTCYPETYDETLGDGGQFMNTRFDTLETLDRIFPGRAEQHYRQYSPLLSALLLACPD